MKTINVSTLKATLSAALHRVRAGETIVVMDRNTPIAEIGPYQQRPSITIHKPKKKFSIPRSKIKVAIDPLDFLMEERGKR